MKNKENQETLPTDFATSKVFQPNILQENLEEGVFGNLSAFDINVDMFEVITKQFQRKTTEIGLIFKQSIIMQLRVAFIEFLNSRVNSQMG